VMSSRPKGHLFESSARSCQRRLGQRFLVIREQRCNPVEKLVEMIRLKAGAITYGAYPLVGQLAADSLLPWQGISCRSPTGPEQQASR
jgi:hypothetical protein